MKNDRRDLYQKREKEKDVLMIGEFYNYLTRTKYRGIKPGDSSNVEKKREKKKAGKKKEKVRG